MSWLLGTRSSIQNLTEKKIKHHTPRHTLILCITCIPLHTIRESLKEKLKEKKWFLYRRFSHPGLIHETPWHTHTNTHTHSLTHTHTQVKDRKFLIHQFTFPRLEPPIFLDLKMTLQTTSVLEPPMSFSLSRIRRDHPCFRICKLCPERGKLGVESNQSPARDGITCLSVTPVSPDWSVYIPPIIMFGGHPRTRGARFSSRVTIHELKPGCHQWELTHHDQNKLSVNEL